MTRVMLVAGVALCAAGLIGVVLHVLTRPRRRQLRQARDLYADAEGALLAGVVASAVELGRRALATWTQATGAADVAGDARLRTAVLIGATRFAAGLHEAGRPGDALLHLTAAEAGLRERMDADPARHRPLLADVLCLTAAAEGLLGQAEEALRYDGRALPIYRQLAEEHPVKYALPLAHGLALESRHFHDIGRVAEALTCASEAVQRLREIPDDDRLPARVLFAAARTEHAAILLTAGRDQHAVTAAAEAVLVGAEIVNDEARAAGRHRRAAPPDELGRLSLLGAIAPHYFVPAAQRRSVTLTVYGDCLVHAGRAADAEAPLRDAVGLARAAIPAPAAAGRPPVAATVDFARPAAGGWVPPGQATGADLTVTVAAPLPAASPAPTDQAAAPFVASAGQAATASPGPAGQAAAPAEQVAPPPAPGEPWLANALTVLAEALTVLGRAAEAVAAAQEAQTLARDLARRQPAAHEPLFARAAAALAAALVADGQAGEASGPAADAAEIYKRLAASRPGRFQREQAEAQDLLGRL